MGDSYADSRFGGVKIDSLPTFNANSANARKVVWNAPRTEKGSIGTVKVLRVSITPTTAGTSTGGNLKAEVLKNTSTLGTVTLNSATAGSINAIQGSPLGTFTTGDLLSIGNIGSDAAGVFQPAVEYQEQFTGTATD